MPGKPLRQAQEEARRMGQIKRQMREARKQLNSDPAATITNCPQCGAPIIDSAAGRAAHAERLHTPPRSSKA
jgi:predicted RNA-binding Zn-ribbon protein involved in translation (DUF1610 family)